MTSHPSILLQMFSFAPPVKVARTQRIDGSTNGSFGRSGTSLARPSTLGDAVIESGRVMLTPSLFLSGTGTHMAWIVDENQKLLRVWNLSDPSWRRTEPRMAQIPFFAAAVEGLPLFVSEMGEAEESLAFCSERGAVSSLDHSVEFQLLDGDAAVSASCFSCLRRTDCGDVTLTAIGTTAGSLAVDVKENGEHVMVKFDRAAFTGRALPPACHKDSRGGGKGGHSSWSSFFMHSVRSFISGGGNGRNSAGGLHRDGLDNEEEEEQRVEQSPDGRGDSQNGGTASTEYFDAGALLGDAGGPSGLAFTHALFRRNYPREVVAVNAASEVMLLTMDGAALAPRWISNAQSALGQPGYVLAVAETRHKISVLFLVTPTSSGSRLPALVLASFSSSQGALIHSVQVNTVTDVVKAAAEAPRHHVRLYVHDSHSHAIFAVRHFCVRVNIQVGVRSPCLSADTGVVEGVRGPLTTALRPDGCAVTLGVDGPVPTWETLWDRQPPAVLAAEADRDGAFMGGPLPDGAEGDLDKRIADMLRAVRADGGRLTLDGAVLHLSEEICLQRRTHRGNWTRADLNAEDENIVLHVTRDLRRRQQRHRRLLDAVLRNWDTAQRLQDDTVAQLISSQEALLSQVALRGLQNVGVVSSPSSLSLSNLSSVTRPFALDSAAAAGELLLLQTVEQGERCQQTLRRAIIEIADQVRGAADSDDDADGAQSATAVELVFSDPIHAVSLLRQVGDIFLEQTRSAAIDSDEKFACAYAVACIFVIVAQTIVESRGHLAEFYAIPTGVSKRLWTASESAGTGVQLAFSHVCTSLASALVDAAQIPSLQQQNNSKRSGGNEEGAARAAAAAASPAFVGRAVAVASQCKLLDLIAYLLHFSFSMTVANYAGAAGAQGGDPQVSVALRQTLLRAPLVPEPFGYPFGVPRAAACSAQLSSRALLVAESLALAFDGVEVLLAFSLSTPTEDPQSHQYAKLQAYCERSPRMLSYALEALWQQRREWELLCLPSVLPAHAPTTAVRDEFLERRAPHLLWLAAPTRFDALALEGTAVPPYIPYGPTQLSHRGRCLSLGKLAWVAAGAARGPAQAALALDAAIVASQQQFLSPQCDGAVLGLQDLVQRLVALDGGVEAWVSAAAVAAEARTDLSEDLLVQVMRRCMAYDGDILLRIRQECVSDLETMQSMRQTAVGAMIAACAPLQDQATLQRLCETVLSTEEQQLVSSWLAAVWSGEQ